MPAAVGWDGETRILVYGVTGSGKTTLARAIGSRLNLPWHEADQLTWEPGWVAVPLETQRGRIQSIVAGESWVLDTAYSKWKEVPLGRAQLIIGLDYPRVVSLSRLLRRCLARMADGKTVCNGNRETLRNFLSRNSIVQWHFASFARKRARIREWEASSDGPPVFRIRTPREAEAFLSQLPVSNSISSVYPPE